MKELEALCSRYRLGELTPAEFRHGLVILIADLNKVSDELLTDISWALAELDE